MKNKLSHHCQLALLAIITIGGSSLVCCTSSKNAAPLTALAPDSNSTSSGKREAAAPGTLAEPLPMPAAAADAFLRESHAKSRGLAVLMALQVSAHAESFGGGELGRPAPTPTNCR